MIERIIFLILLIALSGFFSASESAIFSLPPAKLKALEKKSRRACKLIKLKEHPQRLLITLLIGNNLVNIAASSMATIMAYQFFGSFGPAVAIFILTLLILIFGEIGPKSFTQVRGEQIALAVTPVIYFLDRLLTPVTTILEAVNNRVIQHFIKGKKLPVVSEEELKSLAEIGAEEGVVKHQENEMIKRVLEFKDITAEDVMTTRTRIFSLPAKMKIEEALPKVLAEHYSRIPIYEASIDNIVGVIYLSDILREVYNRNTASTLKNVAKNPYFVPKQRKVDDIFKDFQRQRTHIAVVLDEAGITAGIVTLEDLLEELVGQIMDESDIGEFMIKRLDKNTILVDADTEVKEVTGFLNIEIEAKPQELISAVALAKFGRIPRAGDMVDFKGYKMVVEKATPKKIEKIRIIKTV